MLGVIKPNITLCVSRIYVFMYLGLSGNFSYSMLCIIFRLCVTFLVNKILQYNTIQWNQNWARNLYINNFFVLSLVFLPWLLKFLIPNYFNVTDFPSRCPVNFKQKPRSRWNLAKSKLSNQHILTNNLLIFKTYIGSALFIVLHLAIFMETGYLSIFLSYLNQWLWLRRSNFMISKQEIHSIFNRQFFSFFMTSKVAIMNWSPDPGIFHLIKSPKTLFSTFDLMNNFLVTSTNMRSKVLKALFLIQSHEKFVSHNYNHEIESF